MTLSKRLGKLEACTAATSNAEQEKVTKAFDVLFGPDCLPRLTSFDQYGAVAQAALDHGLSADQLTRMAGTGLTADDVLAVGQGIIHLEQKV